MFKAIADFINLIMTALSRLANPLGGISVPDLNLNTDPNAPSTPYPGNPLPQTKPGTKPSNEGSKGGRSLITIPENISARFDSTGSPAWVNQVGPLGKGYHYGTDYSAPQGSPVFAPYAGNVVSTGYYSDTGRLGSYIIMKLGDGAEYYSGHLDNVMVKSGDTVLAGQQLGVTNKYAHTHVQLRVGGVLTDFESYAKNKKV